MDGVRWLSQGEPHLPVDDLSWLSAAERRYVDGARFPKRRVEFLVSRWTAKLALAAVEGTTVDHAALALVEITRATDGAPVPCRGGQPLGRRISLTDRAGWAVCAISPSDAEVGCDLELIEPRSDLFVADYLTAAEQELVTAAPSGHDRQRLANLVWSAKESALKVLHTGLRRDTRSVEVTFGEADGDDWAPIVIESDDGSASRTFYGWWRRFGAFVLTVAAEEPSDPPVALHGPSPLATAVPLHSWMT